MKYKNEKNTELKYDFKKYKNKEISKNIKISNIKIFSIRKKFKLKLKIKKY